jgi:quinol monooxygenase YgiN
MSEPLVFIDSSEIREGKIEELRTAINSLVEFVESNEPRPLAYNVYINEGGTRMTVVQVHPDSASMEFHMKEAGPAFPKFVELIKLSTMDIYGEPSDDLLEQIRQKVQMLGNATVVLHKLHGGFARFGIQ